MKGPLGGVPPPPDSLMEPPGSKQRTSPGNDLWEVKQMFLERPLSNEMCDKFKAWRKKPKSRILT